MVHYQESCCVIEILILNIFGLWDWIFKIVSTVEEGFSTLFIISCNSNGKRGCTFIFWQVIMGEDLQLFCSKFFIAMLFVGNLIPHPRMLAFVFFIITRNYNSFKAHLSQTFTYAELFLYNTLTSIVSEKIFSSFNVL